MRFNRLTYELPFVFAAYAGAYRFFAAYAAACFLYSWLTPQRAFFLRGLGRSMFSFFAAYAAKRAFIFFSALASI